MNITETLRGAMRRIAGVSLGSLGSGLFADGASGQQLANKRRTLALPSIFNSYGPMNDAMPKPTPYNLRRFSETPVARRAINAIKDWVAGMRWRIQPRQGFALETIPLGVERIRILTNNFQAPNPDDSFRSLAEQVLEDIIVGGFGAIEAQATGDAAWPLVLWPVDGATIRMNLDWDGSPHSQRYMQVTNQSGPKSQIKLDDDELIYIRLNPRTHTPFGLGRLEVAFETINAFLGAHRYASRLASNTVVQYALWLQDLTPEHHERLIRWWQDEIEGTGRVPILSVESKPEVLRFGGGTDADLRLQWQEFLLRIMADAFDLPPFYLGLERDVNRSTAGEMSDMAFRQAIVPTARLFAEHITRDAIHKKLGWNDLEFVFAELDAQDPMEEAQIQQILLQSGVLTVNEVRRMRGLPELGVASGKRVPDSKDGAWQKLCAAAVGHAKLHRCFASLRRQHIKVHETNTMTMIELESMAITLPVVEGHPNRAAFHGVLTIVDVASQRPPAGARGHLVVLTKVAADAALPSLMGMALDYTPSLDRHDVRRKVGVITRAEIVGRKVELGGYLFAKDFPEIVNEIDKGSRGRASAQDPFTNLGMSYEIADARVADTNARVWTLTRVTFTGAAILRRDKAAYRDTWIELGE